MRKEDENYAEKENHSKLPSANGKLSLRDKADCPNIADSHVLAT